MARIKLTEKCVVCGFVWIDDCDPETDPYCPDCESDLIFTDEVEEEKKNDN